MFTVFFADDEPYVIEGLQLMIDWEAFGIKLVGSAGDGKIAYDKITELKPDIVISDIRMPEMNGTELIEACDRSMERTPKFIILSGYSELEYVKKSMRHGAKHYLLKPLDPEEINKTLEEVCSELVSEREREEENERLLQYVEEETFQKLFFGNDSDEIVEKARFLLNVPNPETRLSMILFRLNRYMSSSDTDMFIETLRNRVKPYAALVVYTGMRTVAAIGEAQTEESLRTLAVIGENNCDNICICSADGIKQLRKKYRSITSDFCGKTGQIRIIPEDDNTEYDFSFDIDTNKAVLLLLKQDRDGAINEIKSVFQRMREKNAAWEIARGFMSALLLSMYRYSGEMGMNLEEIYNEAITQFDSKLDFDMAELICIDLFNNFADSVTNLKKTDDIAHTKEILEYIDKHYAEHMTLNDISSRVYLQPGIVSRLIKNETGMKFSDYLAYVRINNAQKLMTNTNKKITQIAEDVGYSYYYYFANRFRSITGCTPSEYRKKSIK